MIKTNGKTKDNKSQTNMKRGAGAPLLERGWNCKPIRALTYTAPYSTVQIEVRDLVDHAVMRSAQLAAVLRALSCERYSAPLILLAQQIADDIARVLAHGGDVKNQLPGQLAALLYTLEGDDGPCDLLWLCQQIADEVHFCSEKTD